MKALKTLLGFVLLICIASCSDDGPTSPDPDVDPDPVVILTIDASEFSLFTGQKSWYFILDSAGNVLETQQLMGFDILKFTAATKNDSITLVELNHYSSNQVNINVYGGIKTQTTIKLGYEDASIPPMPSLTGNASIKVTNYPALGNNPLVVGSPDVNEKVFPSGGTVNASVPIYGESVQVLLSAFNASKVPVYKLTESIAAGDVKTYNFADFTPYPSTLPVPEESELVYLMAGYNTRWEYHGTASAYSQWFPGSATPALIGYLPNYRGYYTTVWSVIPAANYIGVSYSKRGTIPTQAQLVLPDFTYAITESSVKNPDISIDHDYTYKHFYWYYGEEDGIQIHCNLYAPKGFTPVIKQLPDEIQLQYPQFDLNDLSLGMCEFYEHLDGYTYLQTINDFKMNHFHLKTFEYRVFAFAP